MSFEQGSHENNPVKILHEILKLSFDQCSHENNPVKILHEILKLSFDQWHITPWHIRHGEQVREWFSSDWRYHTQFWKWTNLRSSWFIHVIELLCYNWRFGLITGDFSSTYLMCVFIVYWCFPFVCFSIEPTASHFNIHVYCLHFCLK